MRYPIVVLACAVILPALCLSCVEPVHPEYNYRDGFIFMDGEVSNLAGRSIVKLREAQLTLGTYLLLPFTAQSVETIDGAGNTVNWISEENSGDYLPPPDFTAQAGESYFLRIITTTGQVIESDPEVMPTAVPIADLRIEFAQDAYFDDSRDRFIPAFRFLVDFQDPPVEKNYYRFRSRTWEKLNSCLTCYFRQADPFNGGECISTNQSRFATRNDYACDGDCWERTENRAVNIFSDQFINGNLVQSYEAGRSDYDARGGLLVIVEQQLLTERAFAYNNMVKAATSASGGLNSSLPAALDGNINSLTEGAVPVLGYFAALPTDERRHYFNRDTTNGTSLPLESLNYDMPQRYFHPCEGPNRTIVRPDGWPE